MTEWHIFTKDKKEYCANHLEKWYDFTCLFHLSRKKTVEERTGFSRLFSPLFMKTLKYTII